MRPDEIVAVYGILDRMPALHLVYCEIVALSIMTVVTGYRSGRPPTL